MKRALGVLLSLGCAFGLLAWFWLRGTNPSPTAQSEAVARTPTTSALPPTAVLNIDPQFKAQTTGDKVAISRRLSQITTSSALADFLSRKDFATLFQVLRQSPESGESAFLQSLILERCAQTADSAGKGSAPRSIEERRAAFIASLSPTANDYSLRLAAFDMINRDPCGELRAIQSSRKEIAELQARAAALKDPAALARDLNCEVFGSIDRTNGGRFPEINSARFDRIRAAIASRNPVAVRTGVGMLANSYRNGSFRIGPDGKVVDPNVMAYAANLLACQYGADCSLEVARGCANDGKCNVGTYDDYLAYYQLSPNDTQTVELYRAWLTQMIESGDFNQLQLVPGEQASDSIRINSYFACGGQ